MRSVFADKLKPGDSVGIIALSGVRQPGDGPKLKASEKFLKSIGLTVVYGQKFKPSAAPLDALLVEERIQELDKMLTNPAVRAIWIYAGGDNANQILDELDFKQIKKSNKLFLGSSDNTNVLNAIYNHTGLVTYYAPNFRALGKKDGSEFTHEFAKKILLSADQFKMYSSARYFDKDYSKDSPVTTEYKNSGWWVIQQAIGAGTMIGGEISTMLTLHGTPWPPSYKNKVLFLEMYRGSLAEFDRLLEAILQQPGAEKLEALLIGRFQTEANVTQQDLKTILSRKPKLDGVPVIANIDFGHTLPVATLPIGGTCLVRATKSETLIRIEEH